MKKRLLLVLSLIIVFSMVLVACGPAETNTANEENTAGEEVESGEAESVEENTQDSEEADEADEAETTEEETTEEEVPAEPMVLTYALDDEPDTLDPHKTAKGVSDLIMNLLGGSLVTLDSEGQPIPYLAESWEISEDGLIYTFHLKDGITFHNGTPLTAQDFVYTYERALNPDTASPAAGTMIASVQSFEAVDDSTLVITLAEPYYPFLLTMASAGYLQPLSQAYVEEVGDEIGRNPIGVGPYKLAEWQTGDRIVLEVNPDWTWGPEFYGSGPFMIDRIDFRIIPEQATIVAGLEAGEIDYAKISTKDLELFTELPFDILEVPHAGLHPHIAFNVSVAPFDDINVRKAFNMAVDREAVLEVLYQGHGVVRYGPISPSVIGYWPGVEEYGYAYDVEGAKALLEESGYALNADGIYEKDGVALDLVMLSSTDDESIKFAEIIQVMLQEIGVKITIQQEERASLLPKVLGGDYTLSTFGFGYTEADIMYLILHSSQIGGMNYFFVNNPDLDEILTLTRNSVDAEAHQQAVNDAQKMITEEAYFIGAVAPNTYFVVSQNVKDYGFSPLMGIWFNKAYIEK